MATVVLLAGLIATVAVAALLGVAWVLTPRRPAHDPDRVHEWWIRQRQEDRP